MFLRLTYFQKLVLITAALVSLGYFLILNLFIHSALTLVIRLEQHFALIAFSLLYSALFIDPYLSLRPHTQRKSLLLQAKVPLVISAWYFSLQHGALVFWGQLGGFSGLAFLSETYLLAIGLSFSALLLLSFTSYQLAAKLFVSLRERTQHILSLVLYLIGTLILCHAFLVGTHFSSLSGIIPQLLQIALFVLFSLDAIRIDAWVARRYRIKCRVGPVVSLVVVCIVSYYVWTLFFPTATFSIHAEHLRK